MAWFSPDLPSGDLWRQEDATLGYAAGSGAALAAAWLEAWGVPSFTGAALTLYLTAADASAGLLILILARLILARRGHTAGRASLARLRPPDGDSRATNQSLARGWPGTPGLLIVPSAGRDPTGRAVSRPG